MLCHYGFERSIYCEISQLHLTKALLLNDQKECQKVGEKFYYQ